LQFLADWESGSGDCDVDCSDDCSGGRGKAETDIETEKITRPAFCRIAFSCENRRSSFRVFATRAGKSKNISTLNKIN